MACPDHDPERNNMKKPHVYFRAYLAALLMLAVVPAEAADVKELFAIDLADYPGKEGRMIEVSYPPGARDMVHRHDAHAFVYVLEGQIVMQLKGKPAVTLKAGQTFYEGPNDVHVVGRNASNTEPARFVVVLLKGKGAPILTPVKRMMLGTVRPVPSALNGPFHLGKVGCGADSAIPDAEAHRPVSDSKAARCGRPLRHLSQVGSLGP